MLIEFTGCTGSGKSTVAKKFIEKVNESGLNFKLIDVGGNFRFDFIALPWFLCYALGHSDFCRFAAIAVLRGADSKLSGLNIYRNFSKKIGTYLFLRRRFSSSQILWDEGTVHAVHNLFVHVRRAPRMSDIVLFADHIPKPDLIVYVKAPSDRIVQRTLERGHRRVRGHIDDLNAFIENAVKTFDILTALDTIKDRLLVVENNDNDFKQLDEIASSLLQRVINIDHGSRQTADGIIQ